MSPSEQRPSVPYFKMPASEWKQAIGFSLACSLTGLKFYPALIIIAIILLYQWKKNRYFFVVEFIIFCTGSGLMRYDGPVKLCDFAFLFAIVGIIIYRKFGIVKKITWMMFGYFAILFALALTSVEPMTNQISMIRYYLLIISFFIPLVTFANRDFNFKYLLNVIILHTFVICIFYVIDAFIFWGFLLTPGSCAWGTSTIISPIIFRIDLPRHYPYGLYWLLFLIVPFNYKQLKFQWYYWVLIILAIFSSRTNSLLFALITCFIFIRPKKSQILAYMVLGASLISGLYFVDKSIGGPLRIAENIDSFAILSGPKDIEDLAEFGTGRMAQIIPKWELLYKLKREWIGFGFLNRLKTTNPIFQIENELYSNIEYSDEVASGVEVTQVQTILDIGFIGLIIQLAFYIGIYLYIRRFPYSSYYLCLLVGFEMLGFGGFAGLNGMQYSLLIMGLALGAIVLNKIRIKTHDT